MVDCWLNFTVIDEVFINHYSFRIYRYLSPILVTFGLIGNILGAYVSHISIYSYKTRHKLSLNTVTCNRKSLPNFGKNNYVRLVRLNENACTLNHSAFNANQYLLRCFFLTNLINVCFMLIFPTAHVFGNYKRHLGWLSYGWMYYLAHINFPITKPLLVFSFLTYVIFSLNQTVSQLYPFQYRERVTLHLLRRILVLALLQAIIWYLPSYLWMHVVPVQLHNTCDNKTNITVYIYNIMDINPYSPNRNRLLGEPIMIKSNKSDETPSDYEMKIAVRYYRIWIAYDVIRELIIKIFPFVCVMLGKILVVADRRYVKSLNELRNFPSRKGEARNTDVISVHSFHNHNKLFAFKNLDKYNISKKLNLIWFNFCKFIHGSHHKSSYMGKRYSLPFVPQDTDIPSKILIRRKSVSMPDIIDIQRASENLKTLVVEKDTSNETLEHLNISTKVTLISDTSPKNALEPTSLLPTLQKHGTHLKDKLFNSARAEKRQHVRTLFILTIEFLSLLFPIAIIQMSLQIRTPKHKNHGDLALIYDIGNTLEYIYICFSFYINFAFNKSYRHFVGLKLQTLWNKTDYIKRFSVHNAY